ncbi:hypothetical protein BT69DRAFT_1318550 [Atractiella rhizophila]|nr:hypothetical protein BT69DRAFT_1318550 [Atractiella rhizophila]
MIPQQRNLKLRLSNLAAFLRFFVSFNHRSSPTCISIHPMNEFSIIESGFLHLLIDLLAYDENKEIQCHAISTLHNLVASSGKNKSGRVGAGAVDKINCLDLSDDINSDLLNMGILEVLLSLTASSGMEVQGNKCRCYSQFIFQRDSLQKKTTILLMPSETILKAVYTDTSPAFWKTNTRPSNTLLFGRLSGRSNQATQHWNGTSETPLPLLRQINALAIVSVPPNETNSQSSDGDVDDGAALLVKTLTMTKSQSWGDSLHRSSLIRQSSTQNGLDGKVISSKRPSGVQDRNAKARKLLGRSLMTGDVRENPSDTLSVGVPSLPSAFSERTALAWHRQSSKTFAALEDGSCCALRAKRRMLGDGNLSTIKSLV